MDKSVCRVCHKEFENDKALHKHIKAHKLLLAEYYQKHIPRYDKYDGHIILFRNQEQYLTRDFNTRENLKKWIETTEPSLVRAYCKTALAARQTRKSLVWAPSQVELKTAMLPPIQVYEQFFGDYFALCEELGMKNKFKHDAEFKIPEMPAPYTIYVDTREQIPYEFETRLFEKRKLDFGDYGCSNDDITCACYIERKTAKDFAGTFSGGVERFCRELDRARAANAYIIVLVEDTISNCQDYSRQPVIYTGGRKANPEFVFFNVRDIIQKYPMLQFLFVHNRDIAQDMVTKLFDSECSYKDVDLQFFYDIGKI